MNYHIFIKKTVLPTAIGLSGFFLLTACGQSGSSSSDSGETTANVTDSSICADAEATVTTSLTTSEKNVITSKFGGNIDLDNLSDYAGQSIPSYLTKCNGAGISNAKATLGRVLFYDKKLSIDDTVSCASCHQQAFAFSDTDISSDGVEGGSTGRHSMRLVNARFADEVQFFWDERATSLEDQTTQPIQDHNEMGFSGSNGREDLDYLISTLSGVDYYQTLFTFVYGDTTITEARLQEALSHFVRSIQSFDSKFDTGMAAATTVNESFSNFTSDENAGKTLFMSRATFDNTGSRTGGGAGCAGCHRAPEFDIDPDSGNNGVDGSLGGGTDTTVTRSPTLRDIVQTDGTTLNGPLMHTGEFTTIADVIDHYDSGISIVTDLDNRLKRGNQPVSLNLTATEKLQLEAFLKTLSGTNLYTDAKWSDPF